MSKNFKGYMGDQIGKLGPAVGRRWKGQMVYSAYQGRVSNPKTAGQLLVRARFGLLGAMAAAFLPAIQLGLARRAASRQNTESNNFVSLNYGAIEGDSPAALTVGYDELMLSTGHLTGVEFGAPSFTNPLEVSVTVTNANLDAPDAQPTDRLVVAASCPDMAQGVTSAGVATRSDSSVTLHVPTTWQGMNVHVYGFVAAAGEKRPEASSTAYIGFGNIS